jgi:acetyltransferase
LDALTAALRDTMDYGASVGFLPPLPPETAAAYWRGLVPEIAAGSRTLLAALDGAELLGVVQIEWAAKENARHRAEIQKLCVHTRPGSGASAGVS